MIVIKLFIVIGTIVLLRGINSRTAKFWESERRRKRRAQAEALYAEDVQALDACGLTETERFQAVSLLTKGRRAKQEQRFIRYKSVERTGRGMIVIDILTAVMMYIAIRMGSPLGGENFVREAIGDFSVSMFEVFCYILIVQQILHALVRQGAAIWKTTPTVHPFHLKEFFTENEWILMQRIAEQDGDTLKNYTFHWFTREILQFLAAKETIASWERVKTLHEANHGIPKQRLAVSIQDASLYGYGVSVGHPLEAEWRLCKERLREAIAPPFIHSEEDVESA